MYGYINNTMVVVISTYLNYGRWSFAPLWVVRVTHTRSHVQCSFTSPLVRYSVNRPYSVRLSTLALRLMRITGCPFFIFWRKFSCRVFLFFENIFWGNLPKTTAHHTPTGRTLATMEKSLLLLLVKAQDVDHRPHAKQHIVVWGRWVGFATT